MIQSFRDKRSLALSRGRHVKGFPTELIERARVKLAMIEAATELRDLESPPGNQLEALQGNRSGQHGIRINRQWRICFWWREGDAHDVEVVDYH